METEKVQVSFMALDPYIERTIPLPTEKKIQGKDLVEWGDGNRYPEFLLELYNSVPTLRSIINGTTDFIVGDTQALADTISTNPAGIVNTKGDTLRSLIEDLARDYETYGAFAIQVIRSNSGQLSELHYCPVRYLRMNKEGDVFYYSEKWNRRGKVDATTYPAFIPGSAVVSSILYVKNAVTQVYPSPLYCAAVNACETERLVGEFHRNAVGNGFVSSMIVNFNNGLPSDKDKAAIEKAFSEKFCGAQNAGRVMFSWNPDKENATTITEPKVEDFGQRYNALSRSVRQDIFTAFRAVPSLFGILTESKGFSQEEFDQAFRLYNRTAVRPVQRKICDAFDRILGKTNVLTITPFSLDGAGSEQKVN